MSDSLASGHDDLPLRQYPYKGRDDFLAVMDYEESLPNRSEIFLITNINKDQFELDFLNTHDKIFLHAWKEYDFSSRVLIIKMPLEPHEKAGRSLAYLIMRIAEQQMGPEFAILNKGAYDIRVDGKIKRADETLIPESDMDRTYPAVAVEVGLSQTAASLTESAKHWLTESDGEIRAVITVELSGNCRSITIGRWSLENNDAVMKQATTISKTFGERRSQTTFQVTGAPFTIPFEDLYLRPAKPNTNEQDIQITDAQLRHLANLIW
jgi:hypothetical protein